MGIRRSQGNFYLGAKVHSDHPLFLCVCGWRGVGLLSVHLSADSAPLSLSLDGSAEAPGVGVAEVLESWVSEMKRRAGHVTQRLSAETRWFHSALSQAWIAQWEDQELGHQQSLGSNSKKRNIFEHLLPVNVEKVMQPPPVFLLGKSHGYQLMTGHCDFL